MSLYLSRYIPDVSIRKVQVATANEFLSQVSDLERICVSSPSSSRADFLALRASWYGQLQDTILALCSNLPDGVADHEAKRLLIFMIELEKQLALDKKGADSAGRVELAVLQLSDVVHRLKSCILFWILSDPSTATVFVFEHLEKVASPSEIASILCLPKKKFDACLRGESIRLDYFIGLRPRTAAKIVSHLEHSMTPEGIVMWFDYPLDLFKGKSAKKILRGGDPVKLAALVEFARGGLTQLAG